ncbi:hypothetical protein ABZS83_05460 [Streptomyces sp. NPDC005426]|uniref:hypothetical protein n=1 Tax=Streptomyces sp. NPDC005426 TaxID=3155344 RepID=UPI0033B23A15
MSVRPHIVRSEYLNPQGHVSDGGDLAFLTYDLNTSSSTRTARRSSSAPGTPRTATA